MLRIPIRRPLSLLGLLDDIQKTEKYSVLHCEYLEGSRIVDKMIDVIESVELETGSKPEMILLGKRIMQELLGCADKYCSERSYAKLVEPGYVEFFGVRCYLHPFLEPYEIQPVLPFDVAVWAAFGEDDVLTRLKERLK